MIISLLIGKDIGVIIKDLIIVKDQREMKKNMKKFVVILLKAQKI